MALDVISPKYDHGVYMDVKYKETNLLISFYLFIDNRVTFQDEMFSFHIDNKVFS